MLTFTNCLRHSIVFLVCLTLFNCKTLPADSESQPQPVSISLQRNREGPTQLLLTFNRPMPVDILRSYNELSIPASITPAIACGWRVIDARRVACEFLEQGAVKPATGYEFRIDGGWEDGAGVTVRQDVELQFEGERPYGSIGVEFTGPQEPLLSARFNMEVTRESLVSATSLTGPDGETVPIAIDMGQGSVATIRPTSKLLPERDYVLTIAPGVMSDGPLPSIQGSERQFTTFGEPGFLSVFCPFFPFSEEVDPRNWDRTELTRGLGDIERARIGRMEPYVMDHSLPCDPEDVHLRFSTPVNVDALNLHGSLIHAMSGEKLNDFLPRPFEMDREARFSIDVSVSSLSRLNAGERYRFAVPGNVLRDQFGRLLTAPIDVEFVTRSHRSATELPDSSWMVLESGTASDVPVVGLNRTAPLEFELQRSDETEFTSLVRFDEHVTDQLQVAPLGIREEIGSNGWAQLDYPYTRGIETYFRNDEQFRAERRTVQITPFNIHWELYSGESLFWVTRLADASVVANATVEVYRGNLASPDRMLVASAETNSEGYVVIPHDTEGFVEREGEEFHVQVSSGSEQAWLPLSFSAYCNPVCPNPFVAETSLRRHNYFEVLASQPFYQPGELVQLKLTARKAGEDGLAPEREDFEFTLAGPEGSSLPGLTTPVTAWSEFGTRVVEFEVPASYPYAAINLLARPISTDWQPQSIHRIQIINFETQSIELDTSLAHDPTSGEIEATLTSRYYSGSANAQAPARLNLELNQSSFNLQSPYNGFRVGPGYFNRIDPVTILQESGALDGEGRMQATAFLRDSEIEIGTLRLTAEVDTPSGRVVAGNQAESFYGRDRYVGLRTSRDSDQVLSAELLVFNLDKQPVADVPIALAFMRLSPDPDSNAAALNWEPVAECERVSSFEPRSCRFEMPESGIYLLRASIVDSQGRLQVSEVLETLGYPDRQFSGPDQPVTIDGPYRLSVGETATYTINNSLDAGTGLLTISGASVSHRVIEVPAGVSTFEITADRSLQPAFNVSLHFLKPRTGHLSREQLLEAGEDTLAPRFVSTRRVVYVFDPLEALQVDVASDKQIYGPGEQVELTVTNRDGSDEAVEVAIVVVDQALSDLVPRENYFALERFHFDVASFWASSVRTAYRSSDLWRYLIADRPWGTVPFPVNNDRNALRQFVSGLTGVAGNSGSRFAERRASSADLSISVSQRQQAQILLPGQAVPYRTDFRRVAYFLPQLVLEPGQSRSVSFELPDRITRWQVKAVVIDHGHRAASAEADFQTRRDLVIDPALPHGLVQGDRLNAEFAISNRSEAAIETSWNYRLQGPLSRTAGDTEAQQAASTFSLDPGTSRSVSIPLEAAEPGAIRFQVQATGRDMDDIDVTGDALQIDLPVRSGSVERRQTRVGQLPVMPGDRPQEIRLSEMAQFLAMADAVPGSARLEVGVSRGGLDLVSELLKAGRDYPYDGWEPLLSRAVLAAMFLQLSESVELGWEWPEARDLVNLALEEASAYQAEDGGMAQFVAERRHVDPYLSAYTLAAFSWLEDFGYRLPEAVTSNLIAYVGNIISRGSPEARMDIFMAYPVWIQRGSNLSPDYIRQTLQYNSPPEYMVTYLLAQMSTLADPPSQRQAYREMLTARLAPGSLYYDPGQVTNTMHTGRLAQCLSLSGLLVLGEDSGVDHAALLELLVANLLNGWSRNSIAASLHESVVCAQALLEFYSNPEDYPTLDITTYVNDSELGQVRLESRQSSIGSMSQSVTDERVDVAFRVDGADSTAGQASDSAVQFDYRVTLKWLQSGASRPVENQGLRLGRHYDVRRNGEWIPVEQTHLEKSDLVRVRLSIGIPVTRRYVVLSDPLPGGFELINERLATTASVEDPDSTRMSRLYFDQVVRRNERISFYAENVPPGEYNQDYYVRVIAEGDFSALPATVSEMYNPDIFGATGLERIAVGAGGNGTD